MKTLNYTVCIILIATLFSCATRELKKEEAQNEGYRSLAVQKFGQGADFIQNVSGSAVLCVKKTKPTQLNPQLQIAFFIYDLKANKILFEDSIPNGSVSWNDGSSIIVSLVPGTVREDDKTRPSRPGYIYDLRSRKTRDLESVDVR